MSHGAAQPVPLLARAGSALSGRVRPPGDKSISHRSLILGLLAIGETRIEGLLEGDDVLRTAAACRALGAAVHRDGEGLWRVQGVGVGGLREPAAVLDFGNAGTGSRLMMGVAGSHPVTTTFDGDASLRKRPMRRILDPLVKMGVTVVSEAEGGRVPLTLRGPRETIPIVYETPVASAQIKSAVLLAGLNSPGATTVIETEASRDHTERMLTGFGAKLEVGEENGETVIAIHGEADLHPMDVTVPGDPSSAAFFMVAATLVPGSDLTILNVGLNPTRAGLLAVLRQMGADIEEIAAREVGGEPVADLRVRHAPLSGIEVDPAIAPAMIDEFPVLFVAAALASGTTRTSGLEELRVKESDRLATMAAALTLAGARVEEHEDGLTIHGTGGDPLAGTPQGADGATRLDHRTAMSMAPAGRPSPAGGGVRAVRAGEGAASPPPLRPRNTGPPKDATAPVAPAATAEASSEETAPTPESPAADSAEAAPEAPADVAAATPAIEETMAAPLEAADGAVIIRRGDTLWRISRRVYGRGVRYSTIYLANQEQIRDPDMIWPGQIFSVPDETEEGEKADMSTVSDQLAPAETTR
ncbi:MAG: 3-phosphoshikimate 1-carboxyvinyltransferase [Rhizobiaceae bacterium]|nr:3-phosphoshikimate 1-carboxyvinyltransferase [Rhizobiaceae bacterium]